MDMVNLLCLQDDWLERKFVKKQTLRLKTATLQMSNNNFFCDIKQISGSGQSKETMLPLQLRLTRAYKKAIFSLNGSLGCKKTITLLKRGAYFWTNEPLAVNAGWTG